MERLDGPLADLVAAERDEMEAMPKSKDAAWAGVAAAWQPPPAPPPPGATEAVASASKAGVLQVVGALVLGTSVAAGVWAVSSDDTRGQVDRVEAPVVVTALGDVEPPPPPASLPLVVPPPPAPKPRPEEPATRVAPKPTPKKVLGLAEELALVDAMRKDVAAGRYAKALARAKEHRESFAKGSLIADRMDLEAAARCGGGDLDAGRALANRKKKRWPRAPTSQRLRNLCRMD